jgi:hypothetical protein
MDGSLLQLVRSKSSLNYGNILPAASLLLLELHSPLRRTATLSSSHRTAFSAHGIRIQYTGSALLGLGGSPSPVTTCWAHGGAGISILLSLCRVLLRAHAARLAQPREALLPPMLHSVGSSCHTYRSEGCGGLGHKHPTRRLHKVDTHAPRQHRQDHMEQEARTILQIVNRQDSEAGTGFTIRFRAQLQTGSYSEIGILVLHGSSGSNGSEAREASNPYTARCRLNACMSHDGSCTATS